MELLHIAAKLRDQESSDNDSIPFMPYSPNIYESPETGEPDEEESIPTVDEMTEELRDFASKNGTDALKKILQGFGVFRFSELPEEKWLEVIKLMEQPVSENQSSSRGDKPEEDK
jgi:hypothetical protein